jgi:hypothetical protein
VRTAAKRLLLLHAAAKALHAIDELATAATAAADPQTLELVALMFGLAETVADRALELHDDLDEIPVVA